MGSPASFVAAWSVGEPRALFALLLAVPLVVLHLHLKRRRRLRVASLRLVLEGLAPVDKSARFRRLRDRLALASRIAALAAWTAALAGVAPAAPVAEGRTTLLLVDADRTTSAIEVDGRTRAAHAHAALGAWLRSLPHGADGLLAPAAVWRAGRSAEVLAPFTTDREVLGAAVRDAAAVPSPAAVDLDAVVARAVAAVHERGGGRVVVLSARKLADLAPPRGVVVVPHGVGGTRADQGIVDLQLDEGEDASVRATVGVASVDHVPVRRAVRVRVGSLVVHEQDVAIPPRTTVAVTARFPRPTSSSQVVAELLGQDAWGANDELRAVLTAAPKPSVLLVHGGRVRPYTQAVVDALAPDVDVEGSGIVNVRDLARVLDGEGVRQDVVLVDGVALPEGVLRPGAWIFLGPLGGALPFELGPELVEPLVWRTASGHPLVPDRAFGAARALSGRGLAGEGLVPLAFAAGEAVLAEGMRDGVRYVALGLDPERSALPLQADLPLLVRSAVQRLVVAPVRPFPPLVRAGADLRPRAPLAAAGPFELTWSGFVRDGVLEPLSTGGIRGPAVAPQGDTLTVPAQAAGLLTLRASGEGSAVWRAGVLPEDPARSIAPGVPPAGLPVPAERVSPPVERWRTRFLALGALLLLLDLALSRAAPRRPRA